MLRDAALLTLDLCLEFIQTKWILKDATPWNILFDGSTPFLVDVTSIMPQDNNLLWVAYDQFCRLFLFPLLVGEVLSGTTSRALLLYSGGGISPEDIHLYLPTTEWIRHPWLMNRLYLPRLMVDFLQKSDQVETFRARSQVSTFSTEKRRAFFETFARINVNSISTVKVDRRWIDYYQDISSFFIPENFHAKQMRIAEILRRSNHPRL